jgi:hypothetical protein
VPVFNPDSTMTQTAVIANAKDTKLTLDGQVDHETRFEFMHLTYIVSS